jgi:hypothetical protein
MSMPTGRLRILEHATTDAMLARVSQVRLSALTGAFGAIVSLIG